MDEITVKELLANWKCAWVKAQGKERKLDGYTELPDSLEELETVIQNELQKGGVLKAYAELNKEWEEEFGDYLYEEIMRLYELCEGIAWFDISEVDDLLLVKCGNDWDKKTFVQKCMDIIMKAPITIQEKENLYEIQYQLFRLGKEDEVWYAYQCKNLFPKEMLEKLYERLQEKHFSEPRIAWIVEWLNQ